MNPEKITFSYDAEADILYIAFGTNRPAIGLLINDSLLLRVDQRMKALIGLSIFDYHMTAKKDRLELYGLQEMTPQARDFALALLQKAPLNRLLALVHKSPSQLYVKPLFRDLRIENLLMAA